MEKESLSQSLARLLDSEPPLTVGRIIETLGERGFGILLLVLSLPSALPIPAPGYSTPFGVVLAILALEMIVARETPYLPARAKALQISPSLAAKMIGFISGLFRRIEHFIRPRMRWISSRGGRMIFGWVVLFMAVLMMFPIPLTNTFPAFVIFLIGIAFLEEDGVFAVLAFAVGILAVLLYSGLIYLVITEGPQVLDAIKDWLKELLFGAAAPTS